jgi:hypothetical protein
MAFIEQHDARVGRFLKDTRFSWVICNDKKIDSPKFEYPILFGIELEYEVLCPEISGQDARRLYRSQTANRIEHTFKHFAIAKHDGSLNNGFEVVSVPMSRDAHAEQWKPFLSVAEENGLVIRRTCGMHVHVSRELLTPLQTGKILAFIYNQDNAGFIKLIAGRNKPIYTGEHGAYTDITNKKISDVRTFRGRYEALNLRGAETIEFRLFKSTLKYDRLLANLEFCDALIRFTWPGIVGIQEIRDNGLKLFGKFVLENRKRFPYLAEFMSDHNYISWKKTPSKFLKEKTLRKDKKI